jgi:hypothetical protein
VGPDLSHQPKLGQNYDTVPDLFLKKRPEFLVKVTRTTTHHTVLLSKTAHDNIYNALKVCPQ